MTTNPAAANMMVQATSADKAVNLATEIKSYYTEKTGSEYYVNVTSMQSMLDQMSEITSTMSIMLSAIAAISLLVGGIGIMNIMIVTVTERKQEIGIRKALGAKNSSIREQFIVEAMIICLIGGIIGVALGIFLGSYLTSLLGYPAAPSIPGILIALLFSMGIGIFFGYYPANKAAKMNPIDALRYE